MSCYLPSVYAVDQERHISSLCISILGGDNNGVHSDFDVQSSDSNPNLLSDHSLPQIVIKICKNLKTQ